MSARTTATEDRRAAVAEHIRRIVDAAPPLTEEQFAQLREIFRPRSDA